MTEVNWYKEKVKLVVDKAIQHSIEAIAFRVEERTKVNISEAPGAGGQGLIDTGFMLNSVYVVLPDGGTYDQTDGSGLYINNAGHEVERNKAPERPLPKNAGALIAVGADYAIYQEMQHFFLFKALEDTAAEIGGLVEKF